MISREPLAPPRPVPRGFGWIDHRFLRDGHIRLRTHRELSLYLLLVLAADSRGVSFYGDRLARRILGLGQGEFEQAREGLVSAGLVAWGRPLYQVLEIPAAPEGGRHEA